MTANKTNKTACHSELENVRSRLDSESIFRTDAEIEQFSARLEFSMTAIQKEEK